MLPSKLTKFLRFCFIIDEHPSAPEISDQVKIAIESGVTSIILEESSFKPERFKKIEFIRNLCKTNGVIFVVSDDVLLARGISADGFCICNRSISPETAKHILGTETILCKSVSNKTPLNEALLNQMDYLLADQNFYKDICKKTTLPIVVRNKITPETIKHYLKTGVSGFAVRKYITRSDSPAQSAEKIKVLLNDEKRPPICMPWKNEFQLIEKLIKNCRQTSFIKIPPGDDSCLLSELKRPVITTDTQRENVHFRIDWQTPFEIGYKSVIVTLSDLAASYANPVCLFVNLSLPQYISEKTVEFIYEGIQNALDEYNCALGGGNTSQSNQLALDLFAIGECYSDFYPKRSNARPGDGLYVCGPIGHAKAGLSSLFQKTENFPELLQAFKCPKARFREAEILHKNNIKCVMDISDGLYGDANHIAQSSGITIHLNLDNLKFSPAFISFCETYGLAPERMAIEGGEDYALLFSCSPDTFNTIKKQIPDAFQVGTCLKFNGKSVIQPFPDVSSYQHG